MTLTTGMICDIVIILLLLAGLIIGGYMGLLRIMHKIVGFFVAVLVGRYVASWLSPMLAKYISPFLEEPVAQRLAQVVSESADKSLGALSVLPGADQAVSSASEAIANAMASSVSTLIAEVILWILLLIVTIVVMILVLWVLRIFIEWIDELPVLHFLNHLCGAAMGLLAFAGILLLVGWLLRFFQVLPGNVVQESLVLSSLLG